MPRHYGKSADQIGAIADAKKHAEMLIDIDLLDTLADEPPLTAKVLFVQLNNMIAEKQFRRQSCYGRCASEDDFWGSLHRLILSGSVVRKGVFRKTYERAVTL